jgi:RimJ/RimL family protein N-acetyltransferase
MIFETERLLFREFTEDDAPLIYQLNLDPEVIRYTLDPIVDIDHARKILREVIIPQYSLYHYGRWAVYKKDEMVFIGWCGLKYFSELNEVDLGYRFMKNYWGKGFATEAARASLDYGFRVLNLNRIVGRALPGNFASIKVLEKCGMSYVGQQVVQGLLHETYAMVDSRSQIPGPMIK